MSDQDDVWHPEKVEKVIDIFEENPQTKMVFHDGWLIGKKGEPLNGIVTQKYSDDHVLKISKSKFLENTVSKPLANGMVMCISRKLLEKAMAFPNVSGFHDQWLGFCAVLEDSCYFLNEKLVYYRVHGENTAGNSAYKGNLFDRIKKIRNRINKSWKEQNEFITLGNAMKNKMIEYNATETDAYKTAFGSNRVVGAFKLCKLFITDTRYRRSGVQAFLYQLASILIM